MSLESEKTFDPQFESDGLVSAHIQLATIQDDLFYSKKLQLEDSKLISENDNDSKMIYVMQDGLIIKILRYFIGFIIFD